MDAAITDGLHPPGERSLVGVTEILRALVAKELKVKYKRSVLGFVWSLVTPMALAGVYLFVFIYVYRVPQKDFILFLLSGLLPWHYFNMAVTGGTNSIVDGAPLVRKVYFPRILLPIATVLANLVNFLMGLALFWVVLMVLGRPVWLGLHWLLFAVALETILCIGVCCALSVWNVYLRDIRQLISILLLVLFFATPIVYELSLVPPNYRPILILNPLTGVMQAYRAALVQGEIPDFMLLGSAVGISFLALLIGVAVFRSQGPRLAKEV